MRIGIDATTVGIAGGSRAGVYQYTLQLLRQLARIAPEHDYRLLFGLPRARHRPAIEAALSAIGAQAWKVVRAPVPVRWIRRARLPVELCVGAVDVFHGPAHLVPAVWGGASVVTIHDLEYGRERVGSSPPAFLDRRARRMWAVRRRFSADLESQTERSIRAATLIVANSEHTARSVTARFGVSPAKLRVTHLAARSEVRWVSDPGQLGAVRARHGLPEQYGLYLGTLDPNKNLQTLLEGFARYRAQGGAAALALAGAPGWYGRVLQQLAARLGMAEHVSFLGSVADGDLGPLLSGALWSVSPSPLEGFGMTALEAMACRTPVIAAAGGALPEIVGDAALLVPADSAASFGAAMEELAEDAGLRESLRQAGVRRASAFSWESTARQTLHVYREAVELARGARARPAVVPAAR